MKNNDLLIGGAVAFVAYIVIVKIFPGLDTRTADAANKEVDNLAKAGITPTYTVGQMDGFASELVSAFNEFGTDEEIVYDVFAQLHNEADVYLLIAVYGRREYKGTFENFFGMTNKTLPEAIASEFNAGERARMNMLLEGHGINYKF